MKTLWLMLTLVTVLGLSLIGLIEYGELCDLQAVTLDGTAVTDWQTRYRLSPSRPLNQQPSDELVNDLMSRRGVARVELAYALPNRLDIRTNQFTSACFAVDRVNGTMRGLTSDGRIVALPANSSDWQHPILTGVSLGALHQRCRDLRVLQVIPELITLHSADTSCYSLLREIDFSASDYLEATFDDIDAVVRVSHANLADEVRRFRTFYQGVRPSGDSGKCFDARHGMTIVQYVPVIDSLADTTRHDSSATQFAVAEPSAMQLANRTAQPVSTQTTKSATAPAKKNGSQSVKGKSVKKNSPGKKNKSVVKTKPSGVQHVQ